LSPLTWTVDGQCSAHWITRCEGLLGTSPGASTPGLRRTGAVVGRYRSKNAQLVVVRGHGGGMRLGSVSSAVAHDAHAPVIAVRNSE
jgi:hypothetical protein